MIPNRIKKILRGILKALVVLALIFGSMVIIKRTKPVYISTSSAFLNLHEDAGREVRTIRAIYLYPRFNGTMMLRAMGENGELFRTNIFAATAFHGSVYLTGDIYSYGYPITIKRMPINILSFIGGIALQFIPILIYLYFSGLRFRNIFSPRFDTLIERSFNLDKVIGQEHVKELVKRELAYNALQKKRGTKAKQSGILFHGPPGTGKTMFVRALAGTILKQGKRCKLLSMSGGGISELYVGSGPAKIRKLFEIAREFADDGCFVIVFIDEIEAIGSRATNSHSHSNNNIAELLAQLDGVRQNTNIMIIFATNYMNMIDPAVLRSGRVDLKVHFNKPSFSERVDLTKGFLPKKHSITDANVKKFARMTTRTTPAFIKSVFNLMEKTLLEKTATYEALMESWREALLGPELPVNQMDIYKTGRERTAFHEAGHAFVLAVFSFKSKFFVDFHRQLDKQNDKKILAKITKAIGEDISDIFLATIIPRGRSGGMVIFIHKHDYMDGSAVNMVDIICSLAGNAAEKCLNLARVTPGCSADFEAARNAIYKHYVYKLGVNDLMSGSISANPRERGEYDREVISRKTGECMQVLYDFTKKLLEDNWPIVEKIAKELLKKEEIPGSTIYKLLNQSKPTINLESYVKITNFFLNSC